jgi:3-hydroxyacyl-CoA dehydrogenase
MRPIQPLVRLPHSYIDPNELSADPFTYPQKISVRTTRATAITRPRSGPVGDLAGLDIGWHARREWPGRPDDPRFYRVSDLLAEQGRLGRKSGVGFYRYELAVRRGKPDPEVVEVVKAEAARILGEGIARSPADIDVIWCNGYGYPRERRGRMFYAAAVGHEDILGRLGARLMPFTKLAFGRPLDAVHKARIWAPAQWLVDQAKRTPYERVHWFASTSRTPAVLRLFQTHRPNR